MLGKKQKLPTGYQKNPKKPKHLKLVSALLIDSNHKTSLMEKIVKFMIYVALRLVIKPSKWRNPKKNFEIIDRTYKRIMSADFIFIPSSIAFYLIMAFMPIVTIISVIYLIPGFANLISGPDGVDPIASVLGKFIPGMADIINQLRGSLQDENWSNVFPILLFLLITTWIAAGGFAKLVYTQSYIYNHRFVGGYWMNKFRGMILVVQFTLMLAVGLTINIIIDRAINNLPWNESGKMVFSYFVLIVGLFLIVFVIFILLYRFSPRYKISIRQILPGAMVSALPTALFLIVFGAITSLWSYEKYGVVAAIMYIGTASLIVTHFVFMGITANAAYYKTFIGPKVPTKWTLSKK